MQFNWKHFCRVIVLPPSSHTAVNNLLKNEQNQRRECVIVGTDLEIEATPSAFSFAVVSWDVTQSSPKSLRDIPKKLRRGRPHIQIPQQNHNVKKKKHTFAVLTRS